VIAEHGFWGGGDRGNGNVDDRCCFQGSCAMINGSKHVLL
jgi:hypothetical protein